MWRPTKRVEYSDRVEVVAPVRDLAVAEREHGDIPIGVPTPGSHNAAFGGVLEHYDALSRVVVDLPAPFVPPVTRTRLPLNSPAVGVEWVDVVMLLKTM